MKNQKGISVLITSILLIVISVMIIVMVMAWSRNFTISGVNKANESISDKCDKATLSITNCIISDDGNIFLTIKNTSNVYSFSSSDVFQVMVYNDSGLMDEEKDLTLSSGTWEGLEAGGIVIGNIEPTTAALTSSSGALVNVTLRSTICPLVATTSFGCHR